MNDAASRSALCAGICFTPLLSFALLVSSVWGASPDGRLAPNVRATPDCSLEGCPPDRPPGPIGVDWILELLANAEDVLSPDGADMATCGFLNVQIPDGQVLDLDTPMVSPVALTLGETAVATGWQTLTANASNGTLHLILVLEETGPGGAISKRWTLTQTFGARDETVITFGTLLVEVPFGETSTFRGGWTVDAANGGQETAGGDPDFHSMTARMFQCDANAARGGLPGFITAIPVGVVNTIVMIINYIRDRQIPYTPPTRCTGPAIPNGPGQSCAGANLPCVDRIPDLALLIDQLPGVSTGFKQCMKGRLGCGGSNHRRARVTCDFSGWCGPCPRPPALGCNIYGGSQIWYCEQPNANPCVCAGAVFHELSHACGTLDLMNGSTYDSYRIGDWFKARCFAGEEPEPRPSPERLDRGGHKHDVPR